MLSQARPLPPSLFIPPPYQCKLLFFLNRWIVACSLVPKELEATATPGKGADVRLVDKQNEDYVAPAYVAYGGEGQTMG